MVPREAGDAKEEGPLCHEVLEKKEKADDAEALLAYPDLFYFSLWHLSLFFHFVLESFSLPGTLSVCGIPGDAAPGVCELLKVSTLENMQHF